MKPTNNRKRKPMKRKYDTSMIEKELRKPKFYEKYFQYFYALQPLGCVIALLMFAVLVAYTFFMLFTEPSLNGTY